jgi:hypothetical protein
MKQCRIQYIEKKSKKIRLFKMVSGLKGKNTYEEKCAELGLETLKRRKELQDMTLVHKYVMNDRQDLFTLASMGPEPAAGEKCLTKKFARANIRKNSFAVRIVDR